MVRYAALAAVAALVAGCAEQATEPEEISTPLYSVEGTAEHQHGTDLSGSEEVPPRDTDAKGVAIFRERLGSNEVDFHLVTSKISNVHQAHIHCGAFGANGPVRMWLFPVIGPSGAALVHPNQLGSHTGVLNKGTFDPTGVTCPDGTPLIDAMRAGLAYVNVHTTDGVDPANTGPGDFPGGEIRGQLDRR
jgi:hypothetical protein